MGRIISDVGLASSDWAGSSVTWHWHQATPQRMEPVGPYRDYGTGVPRRTRRAPQGLRHRNTTAVPTYDTALDRTNLAQLTGRLSAGQADSNCDVTCSCADPPIHPAAHVSRVLTESGDIGRGGTDRGSLLFGRCA